MGGRRNGSGRWRGPRPSRRPSPSRRCRSTWSTTPETGAVRVRRPRCRRNRGTGEHCGRGEQDGQGRDGAQHTGRAHKAHQSASSSSREAGRACRAPNWSRMGDGRGSTRLATRASAAIVTPTSGAVVVSRRLASELVPWPRSCSGAPHRLVVRELVGSPRLPPPAHARDHRHDDRARLRCSSRTSSTAGCRRSGVCATRCSPSPSASVESSTCSPRSRRESRRGRPVASRCGRRRSVASSSPACS